MKLQDLAAQPRTKQVAKVMESYFGQEVNFDRLNRTQARNMLHRVRAMISEARRQPGFHSSEQNPAYLKLLMMEQGLSHRINEVAPGEMGGSTGGTVNVGAVTATTPAGQAPAQTAQQSTAQQAAQQVQKRKQVMDQIKALDLQRATLNKQRMDLQKQLGMLEGRRNIREASEVQQAQVVLASKDMVDQVQKMIETATSMQFKDLPALVDQIRNEVGYDQATQFNADATAALSGLVGNLQQSKGQLEGALGVVTGQAPQVPGAELGADLGAELGADMGAAAGAAAELPAPEPEEETSDLEASLGRGKR